MKYLFRLAERHLITIHNTRWIMKPCPITWWNLATSDITWRPVTFQNISTAQNWCGNCQVNIWVCISCSVNSNAHTTPVRIYGDPYAHKFCAVYIFLEYHPSSSNIVRCQVPSRVWAWFYDSADDIDFYQMFQNRLSSKKVKYNIIIIDCMRGAHEKLSLSLGRHWFSRGDNFPCYPLV